MDSATVLSMFKQMMEEQRKVITKIMERIPERGQGDGQPVEPMSLPNMMTALSNRIEKFEFDPEADMTFSKWFSRYKDVFFEDAKQLTESAKVRLLCEKLDSVSFEKYQRHVLPREKSQIGFGETVEILKELFDCKSSLFTTRYQCLKLKKSDESKDPRLGFGWNQVFTLDFWFEIRTRSRDQTKIDCSFG
ncbi:hypothetical protein TELCIR_09329 [Teladorsagia circumcincta]|uniref:DUF7083 domain-containing protein n=1 Tax=Teladorsagia circumcincta TaxID=45464 RepID=A0A2G9UF46_TELCI|nr:hypothetical protein TELCIR_09329 [Teladorsagia circumcincta]